MAVKVGNCTLYEGKTLFPMVDSTSEYKAGYFKQLQQRLDVDGYLLIRGVMPETAKCARQALLQHLRRKKQIAADEKIGSARIAKLPNRGFTIDAINGHVMEMEQQQTETDEQEWYKVVQSDDVRNVYAGKEIRKLCDDLFRTFNNERCEVRMQTDCTWIRMRGKMEVTAEHADYFYFKKATTMFSENWMHRQSDNGGILEKKTDTATSEQSNTKNRKRAKISQICKACHNSIEKENSDMFRQCTLCYGLFHIHCLNAKILNIKIGEFHCPSCANKHFPFYTCWISLGDNTTGGGALCMLPGSQNEYTGFEYKNERLPSTFTKAKQKKSKWVTAQGLTAGDTIIFNIKTIHAASANLSDAFRLSLDTRVAVVPTDN